MMYVTVGVIAALVILVIIALVFGEAFSELPSFMFVLLGAIVLLIGAAIYLSFAVPSMANINPLSEGAKDKATVTQDQMAGLELQEE
jgi:predicted membrane channel-forming protein YqfA (hemolysin III family)